MNGWKEGMNQGQNIRLPQDAFSKQANHFQIYQNLCSIKKKANIPWKYSWIFYIDPEHYKWQEIQRKVKSTLCTSIAIEEGLKNVEQSRKHLDQVIILKNKDTCPSVQSFYLKKFFMYFSWLEYLAFWYILQGRIFIHRLQIGKLKAATNSSV